MDSGVLFVQAAIVVDRCQQRKDLLPAACRSAILGAHHRRQPRVLMVNSPDQAIALMVVRRCRIATSISQLIAAQMLSISSDHHIEG